MSQVFRPVIYSERTSSQMKRWLEICNFLGSEENKFMTPGICIGCGFVMLYDKNRTKYKIQRHFTRDMVDSVINKIKEINGVS